MKKRKLNAYTVLSAVGALMAMFLSGVFIGTTLEGGYSPWPFFVSIFGLVLIAKLCATISESHKGAHHEAA